MEDYQDGTRRDAVLGLTRAIRCEGVSRTGTAISREVIGEACEAKSARLPAYAACFSVANLNKCRNLDIRYMFTYTPDSAWK